MAIDKDNSTFMLPGYEATELPTPSELLGTENWGPDQWQKEFDTTRQRLINFFGARDPYVVLARTAVRHLMESMSPKEPNASERTIIEQAEVEIAQTFLLLNSQTIKSVPTSPANFERYWPLMSRHIHAFIRKNISDANREEPIQIASGKARLQTLYYRNLFNRPDCENTILEILKPIDAESLSTLGYSLSTLFWAMVEICDLVVDRFEQFAEHINVLMTSKNRSDVLTSIDFFQQAYPLAAKVWRNSSDRFSDLEVLRFAGFQMSEMAWPWVFTLSQEMLNAKFNRPIVNALNSLSLTPGRITGVNPQHIYLNNPIWKQPYIKSGNNLFVPISQLVFSFPFAIIEEVISGHEDLIKAYEESRAICLERTMETLLSTAMPSAKVYRGVIWTDPDTGKTWENDIVVLIGNYVFVFEAKSGRIYDAARRGGDLSLLRNFKELFVEPGMQGWRLQDYLNRYQSSCVFRLRADNSLVDFNLDRPKVVFRYSVCYEHFASMTSAKKYLTELNLITNDTAWAPVLSLGEIQMLARHLDTEISFIHYLTRRANIEDLINFEGDEQDLLSMYFFNRFCIPVETPERPQIVFFNADSAVRIKKIPRQNRSEVDLIGVPLSAMWQKIVSELYQDTEHRHRFDIINVILNQLPPALDEFEKRIRKFKRGVPTNGQDVLITKFAVGPRKTFVLACHLAKKLPSGEEWLQAGRDIVAMFAKEDTTVECATFLFVRRSKEKTFDGGSFYRYGFAKKPDSLLKE